MPNYVYTTHHITGQATDIQQLHNLLQRVDNHPDRLTRAEEYYGHTWLGYLLQELRIADETRVDSRGQITGYHLDDQGVLWLHTESAWSAPTALHDVLREQFPSLRILYFTEPDDDGTMLTNDVKGEVFTTRYGIATDTADEQFFDTAEDAQHWFTHRYGIIVHNIEELRDAIFTLEEEQDVYISLHECLVEGEE